MSLTIINDLTLADLEDVRALLWEYARIRNYDEALGDYRKEIKELPGEFTLPEGNLLLARWKGKPAGLVASRKIAMGITEMKRLFVLPDFRGKGIGKVLVQEVIDDARSFGYLRMRLDTHPWMENASKLYGNLGFEEIEPYRYNPTKGIRFFELKL